MTNYRSPSFDPKTGLFIVSASPSYSLYFSKPADGTYGWAGADYGLWSKGVLEAIDYKTGKVRWSHELGQRAGSGVLTTASGLTFSGDWHQAISLRWIRRPARRFGMLVLVDRLPLPLSPMNWMESGCIDEWRRSDLRMGTSCGSGICSRSTVIASRESRRYEEVDLYL